MRNPLKILLDLLDSDQKTAKRSRSPKLTVEELEARFAPAQIRLVESLRDTAANGVVGELRSEIASADSGDTIRINIPPNSTIRLDQVTFGVISTEKNLTFETAGGRRVFINGQGGRAFSFQKANEPVIVSFSNINFEGCSAGGDVGGAIYVRGSLTLTACNFFNNSAARGGAVNVKPYDSSTYVTITGCNFNQNVADAGGALYVEPQDVTNQEVTATITINGMSAFDNNRATAGRGGAINVTGAMQTLVVNDSKFSDNRASIEGGAIFATCASLTVTDVDSRPRQHLSTTRRRLPAAPSNGHLERSRAPLRRR
jgi:predicted outer membrane repeat protein